VGVMRCFVRFVAAEGVVGMRRSRRQAPPPSPGTRWVPALSHQVERGNMLRGAGCSSLCGLYNCAEEGSLPRLVGLWPFTPPPPLPPGERETCGDCQVVGLAAHTALKTEPCPGWSAFGLSPLPLLDGGGWVGVMRCFVRLVAAERLLARAMRLSTYEIISPLTPEPAGFPPSPTRGEGDMR